MLLRISRDKIQKIDIINTEGMTGEEVYKKYMPDYLINLALYDNFAFFTGNYYNNTCCRNGLGMDKSVICRKNSYK